MKRIGLSVVAVIAAVALLAVPALAAKPKMASYESAAAAIAQLYSQSKPLPLPKAKASIKTIAQAYKFQAVLVKHLQKYYGPVIGYKGGLTSPGARKQFKVRSAVTGVMLQKMLVQPGATVPLKAYVRPFIEVEVAFIMAQPIKRPVKWIKNLKKMVKAVGPAIELPDICLADMKNLSGLDIIAADVAPRYFIVGRTMPHGALKLDKLAVTLSHNGKVVRKGVAKAVMGGQWKGLRWAINNIIAHGGQIKAGDVIITGSMTPLYPGKPGKYVAEYGPLGKVTFTLK
jgi:2-keto-4-pentenoate hydratase